MTVFQNIMSGIRYWLGKGALFILRWTYVRAAYRVTLLEEDGGKTEIRYYDQSFEDALGRYGMDCRYKTEVVLSKGTFRKALPRFLPFRWYFHMEIGMPWPRPKAGGRRGPAPGSGHVAVAKEVPGVPVPRTAVVRDAPRRQGNDAGGGGGATSAKPEEEAASDLLSLDKIERAREEYIQTRELLLNKK